MNDVMTAEPAPLILDTRPIFDQGKTPCGAIDAAIGEVKPGQPLVLIVPFEPIPLYAKLGNLGFAYESHQLPDGAWRAEFRRTAATPVNPVEIPKCGCGGAL